MALDDVDLRILSELMKNSKMSDREIAKKLKVSQPTITRRRAKLERKKIIKEYTAIPDFLKLGYQIMALTFVKLRESLTAEQVREAQLESMALAKQSPEIGPYEVVMAERGMGLGYNGVFISYHKSYTKFIQFKQWLSRFRFFEAVAEQSFLINLDDEVRYMPLTFSQIANHLTRARGKKGSK